MKSNCPWLLTVLVLAIGSSVHASTTLYVNGINGNDSNSCKSSVTACKTIHHAITLASPGDFISVAAATYRENLTIGISLTVIGSGARTTVIDGGAAGRVVMIPTAATNVTLSNLTISNGTAAKGGGIANNGTLTINNCSISGNRAQSRYGSSGGGISNAGTLKINHSTISGNSVSAGFSAGGGISNTGTVAINNSTVSKNAAPLGGGLWNQFQGTAAVSNSTFSGNTGYQGSAIGNGGKNVILKSSTVSGNTAARGAIYSGTSAILQNSIVSNNGPGGNCYTTDNGITSNGYNLSTDTTCNFNNVGDMTNINPMLGVLGNNGGPTQTMALLPGSPAIDAGDPNGCTDPPGQLLKTDQRGMPRPDKEDAGGCDMGAYERQSD